MTNAWTKWLLLATYENIRPGHSVDPALDATLAAIADLEEALETMDRVPDPVGHGTIRLRGRPVRSRGPRPSAGVPAELVTATAVLRQPTWAGHGAIRLR